MTTRTPKKEAKKAKRLRFPKFRRRAPRAVPVEKLEHLRIPMPDGRRLSAQVWLPKDAARGGNRVPAILEYTPYGKADGHHPTFARRGYASVLVEVTGTGDSEGVTRDEYTKQEREDALNVLKWIANQKWSDGQVGMMGTSYQGFNSLQVAAMRPPELKAIFVAHASENRYTDDAHYRGGALLTENSLWATHFFAGLALPPSRAALGRGFKSKWLERLESIDPVAPKWLGTPDETGRNYLDSARSGENYWKTPASDPKRIQIPVYAMGGWADGYVDSVMRLMKGTSGPARGLIGPWSHGEPGHALPGPRIGYAEEALKFWDHTLKGIDNGFGAEPKLRAWMQESVPPDGQHEHRPGRWVAEPRWPESETVESVPFHLSADATLSRRTPMPNRSFVVDSPQSLGHAGGKWAPFGPKEHFPADQREDDVRSLVFDVPVTERSEILGGPTVKLRLRSDSPGGNVIVRLNDVHPDGRSTRVTYGVLNLRHREGHDRPKALTPGREYEVEVKLNDVAYAFPPGHKIRLAISNAYWPLVWPAAHSGKLTVESRGSALHLPLRRIDPHERPPEPAPSRLHMRGETWDGRHVFFDQRTGEHVTRIGGEEYRIKDQDPTSATMRVRTEAGDRHGWVRVETYQTADQDHFRVRTRLEAFIGQERIFERSWDQKVERPR